MKRGDIYIRKVLNPAVNYQHVVGVCTNFPKSGDHQRESSTGREIGFMVQPDGSLKIYGLDIGMMINRKDIELIPVPWELLKKYMPEGKS